MAYLIPPDASSLKAVLSMAQYVPFDFSAYETVNAPLIPTEDD